MQMVYAGAIVGLTFTGLALIGLNMPMFSNAEREATATEVPRPAAPDAPEPDHDAERLRRRLGKANQILRNKRERVH